MGVIESAFFDPSPGDRIRILVEYKGVWKALFWIKVAKDGSIYLGPRITAPKTIKKGKSIPDSNGFISISYSEGDEVDFINQPNIPKASFHASGIINSLCGRSARSSLRNTQRQEQLCAVFFQHPDRFDEISLEKLKKRDICLRYPIEDDYPLFMNIFVASKSKLELVDMGTEKHQVNIVLTYEDLDGIDDIAVQLCLFAPAKGAWPPYTYTIYPTKE